MRTQIDMIDDTVNLLVGQEALIQALIQEVIVKHNNFINCFYLFQVVLEFCEIRLKYFEKHVIKVILTELEHLMSGSISLREHILNVAFLR